MTAPTPEEAPGSPQSDSGQPDEQRPVPLGKGCAVGCLGSVVLAVVLLLGLSMCGGGGSGSPDVSKYTQTWPKGYDKTTCDEWNGGMSSRQKWAAAADMLTAARNKGDGGTGLPRDSLITEFQGAVTTGCVLPTMSIAETAVGVYLTEPRFAP